MNNKNTAIRVGLACSLLTIAAVGAVVWLTPDSTTVKNTVVASADYNVPTTTTYSKEELSKMDAQDIIKMQMVAETAAIAAVELEPVVAPLTERPEYVSSPEWIILNGVASRHETPDLELVRLVNLLRFNKQMEALNKATDDSVRIKLAEAILRQMPDRVSNKEMSIEKAQSIQLSLINTLYTDPEQVRERAAEEAERIGAQFQIRQS
ncbi:MAG: hypothetical protein VB954_16135 [Thalassolituus sp.]|uniref:hypothetical protein n=1 Tax=Thalassolituus TaxID=187492 RepID=UPI000BDC864B|nr:hypothetical protein [Thalassolituus oleivorans]PCI48179.1 MAG: hypothetical protein COB43_09215 [Oceanospirillales bacterium]PHQ88321.1 MAG: hypothetical protein COB58_00090 [Thalassobium sp.]|tara:strand:- start:1325 stop:1948 length:624 start_codon:yes stop_codon:yes gene_type:complete